MKPVTAGLSHPSLRSVQAHVWLDIGNEELRAQIKTLQYKVESFEQEREITDQRHQSEVRDAQAKAEADYKRAQVSMDHKIIDGISLYE